MERILKYLMLLVMPLMIAACMQPANNTPSGGGQQQEVKATTLYAPVQDDSEQATADETDLAEAADLAEKSGKKPKVKEKGSYTDKERVALYIHTYGHLPNNYITKAEAQRLGWDSQSGNLRKVAPGKSIGGDKFGNYEGQLPKDKKRKYYECDIDYGGGRRNAKRIIFSNDGLIFYTDDHYKTFEQLY
jgi:guanyl-specific ribonuclease Sa